MPRARRCRRALILALLGALATSCQHGWRSRDACSGASARPGAPRTLHLRVLLEHDGARRRHEAVVQVEAGRIRVVGLTPMGTQAFTLTHEGQRIALDDRVGRRMGQSPRLVYDAIAHAFLAGPAAPSAEPASAGEPDAPVVLHDPGPPPSARVRHAACGYEAWLVVLSDAAPPGAR